MALSADQLKELMSEDGSYFNDDETDDETDEESLASTDEESIGDGNEPESIDIQIDDINKEVAQLQEQYDALQCLPYKTRHEGYFLPHIDVKTKELAMDQAQLQVLLKRFDNNNNRGASSDHQLETAEAISHVKEDIEYAKDALIGLEMRKQSGIAEREERKASLSILMSKIDDCQSDLADLSGLKRISTQAFYKVSFANVRKEHQNKSPDTAPQDDKDNEVGMKPSRFDNRR